MRVFQRRSSARCSRSPRFHDATEAVALANDVDYGLANRCGPRTSTRCCTVAKALRSGTVWVNTTIDAPPTMPFGGYKASGFGREMGQAGLRRVHRAQVGEHPHGGEPRSPSAGTRLGPLGGTCGTVRICDAAEAAALVPDGATVLVDGSGGGVNEPAAVLAALEERFLGEAHPRDLTLVHVSGMGDGQGGGIDRFAHEGMVRRVIGGHWGWTQGMQAAGVRREDRGLLPAAGHAVAPVARHRGRPAGAISAVGLGTFVDPRHGGGGSTPPPCDDVVQLIELAGKSGCSPRRSPSTSPSSRGTRADTARQPLDGRRRAARRGPLGRPGGSQQRRHRDRPGP